MGRGLGKRNETKYGAVYFDKNETKRDETIGLISFHISRNFAKFEGPSGSLKAKREPGRHVGVL